MMLSLLSWIKLQQHICLVQILQFKITVEQSCGEHLHSAQNKFCNYNNNKSNTINLSISIKFKEYIKSNLIFLVF